MVNPVGNSAVNPTPVKKVEEKKEETKPEAQSPPASTQTPNTGNTGSNDATTFTGALDPKDTFTVGNGTVKVSRF